MATPSGRSNVISFGLFEAEPASGQLLKEGERVRLQDQPFRMLMLLLERPGEAITREELREKLWPENTFVEFDNGLNVAVKKIRDALGDNAENPRFVEDVVREMLHSFSQRYAHLPDETVIVARSEAEESIHKHNAYAERTATLGELREG